MKTKTIERLRRFANYNRVTKFVAKLLFMKPKFHTGDIAYLFFDKSTIFLVSFHNTQTDMVVCEYFDKAAGIIKETKIPSSYLRRCSNCEDYLEQQN